MPTTIRMRKEDRSNIGRLMRAFPRRPGADPGGRNPIIQPCPAGCGGKFGVAAMVDHLAHECPNNDGPDRISQVQWRKINARRIARERREAARSYTPAAAAASRQPPPRRLGA